VAASWLGRPLGLAFRLQRGGLIGWSVGVFLLGVAYGSVGNGIEKFVKDNKALNDWLTRTGGANLTDSYLATVFLILALIGTGYAVSSALRLRAEETAARADPLLATGVSRRRWAASHLAVAMAGSVLVLAAGGLGAGLTYGIVADDLAALPRLLGAALAYAPALWLLVGLAAALFGLAPRGVLATWAAMALCFVVGLFGAAFDFPRWLNDASPFRHVPQLPADDVTVVPLAILVAVAAGLTSVGLAAFRRRDVG
jgi:ABC-2 type transport system permease protein